MTLSPAEISPVDFHGCRHAHVEGYLVFNHALADSVLAAARAGGCTTSVDLSSFEVVNASRDWLFLALWTAILAALRFLQPADVLGRLVMGGIA